MADDIDLRWADSMRFLGGERTWVSANGVNRL